ncbi:MAG: DUF5060 domain-containing protein [Planctomycetes bacterium]|nr:DUF5060 domain-containing protein [Planctomycetota bacterium]
MTFLTPQARVGRFEVWEAEIRVATPAPGNPFIAGRVTATFTHTTSGRSTDVEGFCDAQDGSSYRVRFAPRELGSYSFTLRYADGVADSRSTGGFLSTPGGNPGFLRVDAAHPRHFVREGSGRPFYLLGHTAYHLANPVVSDQNWMSYVDHVASLGFNKVRMLLSGGRNRFFWNYRLFPWTGDIDTSTFDQFDVSLWQRFDRVIRYMGDRGIIADVLFEVGTEDIAARFSSFEVPSDRERAFYRYGIDRLGAYSNVVWNLGNEVLEFHSQAWCNTMGPFIKSIDPYGHLLSVHGFSAFPFGGQTWADNIDVQAYSGGGAAHPSENWWSLWYQLSLAFRWQKPIVDDEYGYEIPYSPDQVRKSAWTIAASGAYGSYGSNDSLTVTTDEQRLWSNEVADAWVAKMKTFFEKTDWWLLQNDQGVVHAADQPAICLAERGSEYIVYLPAGGTVTLGLDEAAGLSLPIEWVDPITLETTTADPPFTMGMSSLVITAPNPGRDSILHIGKLVRDQRYFDAFALGTPANWAPIVGTWAGAAGAFRQTDAARTGSCTTLLGRTFTDFSLDIDVRIPDDPNHWAGISFRKEDPRGGYWTSGYLLLLRNNGLVDLLEATNRSYRSLSSVSTNAVIARGWNHVSIIARDGTFQVYVNRQRILASTSDSAKYRSGYLSLAGESGVVEFDNIRLRPMYFEDWDDGVSDGIRKITGTWLEQNREFVRGFGGRVAVAAVDFQPSNDFRVSVDVNLADRNSRQYAGLLLSQGAIAWPFTTTNFVIGLSNRGPGGVPALAFLRAGTGGQSHVVGWFIDTAGTHIQRGGTNNLSFAVSNGVVSIDVNGETLLRFPNQASAFNGLSIGMICGNMSARFDNLVIRDER